MNMRRHDRWRGAADLTDVLSPGRKEMLWFSSYDERLLQLGSRIDRKIYTALTLPINNATYRCLRRPVRLAATEATREPRRAL